MAGQPGAAAAPDAGGMLNSVGLQGPGIAALARPRAARPAAHRGDGRRQRVGPHGRRVPGGGGAARRVLPTASSPWRSTCRARTLHGLRQIFAHDPRLSAEVVAAVAGAAGRPVWAKLSPNTDRVVEVASGGARRRGRGGDVHQHACSAWPTTRRRGDRRSAAGAAVCPARRSTRSPCASSATSPRRCPASRSIGVGGVATSWDAEEFLLAGAVAVQVGTATFHDPRAPIRILAVAWRDALNTRS